MANLNKYSSTITITEISGIKYFFYKDELKAVYLPENNDFLLEGEDMLKKSLIEAIQDTYEFKYKGAEVVECYCLNNILSNIKYVK